MSSPLRSMVERLRASVLRMPAGVFAGAAGRQPAFAGYNSIGGVLEALADEHDESYPERDALTRAMLGEHHAGSGESLWSSGLLVAYYPMLSRLRYRLVCDTVPRDELDQTVVASFLAAVDELRDARTDRVAMRLRQRTERHVFAFLRREREHRQPAVAHDTLSALVLEGVQPRRRSTTEEEMFELALLLERAETRGIAAAGLDIVEATILNRELLRSYVDRTGPDDDAERERTYQRLKRQRSRALKRLRAMVHVSPVGGAARL